MPKALSHRLSQGPPGHSSLRVTARDPSTRDWRDPCEATLAIIAKRLGVKPEKIEAY